MNTRVEHVLNGTNRGFSNNPSSRKMLKSLRWILIIMLSYKKTSILGFKKM